MDPNTTLRLFFEAFDSDDQDQMADCLSSLVVWVRNGGFIPSVSGFRAWFTYQPDYCRFGLAGTGKSVQVVDYATNRLMFTMPLE